MDQPTPTLLSRPLSASDSALSLPIHLGGTIRNIYRPLCQPTGHVRWDEFPGYMMLHNRVDNEDSPQKHLRLFCWEGEEVHLK